MRMSVRRSRRILLAALGISLLIHLILAGYIRWPDLFPHAQQPQRITVTAMTLLHRKVLPTPPRFTPPPRTPPPAVTLPLRTPPPVAPRRRLRTVAPAPPRLAPSRRAGRVPRGAGTGGTPTASPAPALLPTPVVASAACRTPNAPAAVSSSPPVPDLTDDQRAAYTQGVASVTVTVGATGAVEQAVLASTSGSVLLDGLAVALAREAAYAPAYANCRAVPGTVVFRVGFVPMGVVTPSPAPVR